jgi:hypothetical protein
VAGRPAGVEAGGLASAWLGSKAPAATTPAKAIARTRRTMRER